MDVMRDESFGPIIGIQKVAGDDQALALMNDTRYGLTAGMYTRDEARARALLHELRHPAPLPSWCCFACGELVEGQFFQCWNCGSSRADRP